METKNNIVCHQLNQHHQSKVQGHAAGDCICTRTVQQGMCEQLHMLDQALHYCPCIKDAREHHISEQDQGVDLQL